MLIRKPGDLLYSATTPRQQYLNRRSFLLASGAAAAVGSRAANAAAMKLSAAKSKYGVNEKETPYQAVTTYNNYYEFGTSKDEPAKNAGTLRTRPWTVVVEGAVAKPGRFDIDSILKLAPLEERIYRHRCVEGWSMVIPWIGFSLSALLNQAQPTSKARYVAFESLYDAKQMPYGRYAGIPLPYVEGLRIDEALHPLALLAVGLYGEVLPNQNGAPLRLVVPWKYGFKSIKAIVKIRLTESQPPTTWNISNAHEYGFYSNVNPEVDHPRWSQSSERRIGEFLKRPTLKFNGYNEVAGLYNGLDLRKNY